MSQLLQILGIKNLIPNLLLTLPYPDAVMNSYRITDTPANVIKMTKYMC